MAKLELAFDILARDRASKTLDDIGGKADGLAGKLGGIGSTAKVAVGGAAVGGIAALGTAMVQGVQDAASYQKLQARTASVIESTGNAAGISVEGVQSLAGELESISGVDEEEIINSQNVLATFKKISNAGPGETFDDAARAALDMSTALGTDLQSATQKVGKALNDPIKGMSQLSRLGVQFTDEQKAQVAAMVESGDVMGAQKILLGELETSFGGAAKAAGSGFSGSMARLQDAVGDAFREIGTVLLPVLTDLAEWLAENLPGAIERFKRGLKTASEFIDRNVIPVLSAIWRVIRDDVMPVVEAFARFFVERVLPVLDTLARFIFGTVLPAIGEIATKVGDVATTVGEKVGAIVTFFTDLPGNIAAVAGDVWGFLRDSFVGVLNFIITAWNGMEFKLPSFEGLKIAGQTVIPGWEGPTLGLPNIPLIGVDTSPTGRLGTFYQMHTGGTVTPWGVEPLRSDEVFAKLQVGETVLPAGSRRGDVHLHMHDVRSLDEDALVRAAAWRLA